jgi:two-component system response regulator FimZ (fimbrial Z protein)
MGPTVLIVDDHAGFRAGARALLEADGFRVLREADNGEAGIAAARRVAPDVVLLDVRAAGDRRLRRRAGAGG